MNILPKVSKIYYFLTSLLLLFPPLSAGLTLIYFQENRYDMIDIIGLIMNYSFVLILLIVIFILLKTNKIKYPQKEDVKFFIFGLCSNLIIYLFAFQEFLEIEDIVDLYLTTIVLLFLYYILVNREKLNKELWTLSIFYFLFYKFHVYVIERDYYSQLVETTWYIRLIYLTVPLIAVIFIGYKIYKTKYFNGFSYAMIGIYLITLFYLFEYFDGDNKFFLTLFFISPFIFIVDIIVSRINKNPNHNRIIFYMRIFVLILITAVLRGEEYFTSNSYSDNEMFMMTFIMSAVIFINIISYFIPKHEVYKQFNFNTTLNHIDKILTDLKHLENKDDILKSEKLLNDLKEVINKNKVA